MTTKQEILASLNEYQRDAVLNYNGKMSLEATAGSGKSTVLVSRCQYLVKDGVKPSRILAFTFTKKAANELKTRISAKIGPDADKMTICTYHSFCGKILRKFPEYAERSHNFSIYDEDEKKLILKKLQSQFRQAPDKLNVITSYISRFKSEGKSPKEVLANPSANSYERACGLIYQAYERELIKRNAFDFDDLPYYAFKIVSNNKEVFDAITSQYDYILSDENQDANKQNMDFIMLLGSRTGNIFVVGDTDQSIYGFRGADVDNVIDTYKKQDFNIKFLPTNYRSTQNIVNASNSVIKNNKFRIVKEVKTDNEVGSKVKYVKCNDQIQEAGYIAYKIKKILEDHPDYNYKDFAVLTRVQAETGLLEEAFLTAHLPYVLKGVPFYARTEIKDILAYLKLAYNPQDKIAFERVINVPKRGIGKATVDKILLSKHSLNDIMNNKVVIRNLGIAAKARFGFEKFIDILIHVRQMITENKSIEDLVSYVINATEYNSYLEKEIKMQATVIQKKANIQELIYISQTWNNSIEDFLTNAYLGDDEVNIDQNGNETIEDVDGVNIMTIHSSKGLEFVNVFIFDCTDNYLPYFLSHDKEKQVEEERRLFFVAMTRAKKNLFLMYPAYTMRRNGIMDPSTESRFVKEIPKEYLEKIEVRAS